MSNEEFENYLALVTRLLRLNRSQREMIRNEMRDHLETRVEEMVDSGVDRKDAVRSALEEFGDAAGLANQFQIISNINQRRWMMRFATFSIIGTFVAAVFVMAMWPSDARFGAPSASIAQDEPAAKTPVEKVPTQTKQLSASELDKKIRESLHQQWSPDYAQTSFIEVMDEVAEEFNFNVVLDDSAREDSLTEDTQVSFKVANIPMRNGMRLLLKKYNASYVVKDGVMRIISLDVASDPVNFVREIISCRELLHLIATNEKHRVGAPISVTRIENAGRGGGFGGGGFGGGGLRGGGVFSILSADDDDQLNTKVKQLAEDQEKAEVPGTAEVKSETVPNYYVVRTLAAEEILISLIKMTIDPDNWDDTNGDGTIGYVGGCLVVSQIQEVVDDLHVFLDELTEKLKAK